MKKLLVKVLKAFWVTTKFSSRILAYTVMLCAIGSIFFASGFIARPELYDIIPDSFKEVAGHERSHTNKADIDVYENRYTVGVFNKGDSNYMKVIDPDSIKTILRGDLLWVVDVEYNVVVDIDLEPAPSSSASWYTTTMSDSTPESKSYSYMTASGPVTIITLILETSEHEAFVMELTLFNVEDYKVNAMRNEPLVATPEKPAATPADDDEF